MFLTILSKSVENVLFSFVFFVFVVLQLAQRKIKGGLKVQIVSTSVSYINLVNEVLPGAKIIKLKGYSGKNTNYGTAKTPPKGYKWQNERCMTDTEIQDWITQNGWIGAVIPQERIIVDVDDVQQGLMLKDLLEAENVNHHSINTPNGYQFIFKAEEQATKDIKQITKFFTQIGVIIDTRTAGAGYIVFPSVNTEGRYITSKSIEQLDEVPHYLRPIRSKESTKNKQTGEYYEFPIPIDEQGSRNDTLYKFAAHLKAWRINPSEIQKAMELIYEYFLLDKTDFTFNELKTLTNSAINWKPEPTNFQMTTEEVFSPQGPISLRSEVIPLPFFIAGNTLTKKVVKKVDGFEVQELVMVSRMAPRIMKELSNIERNSMHFQIAWTDRGREKFEIVPASTLSTKREMMTLADNGFPVNDLNFKDLISFFDKFLAFNRIEQSQMVERLGHIKNAFIHPLNKNGIEIVPSDSGEKQILDAFETKGTVNDWLEKVFDRVKHRPKVLFMVLSSFASVMLRELNVKPFIVDLSGSTSQGKTTALHVARSVWGSSELISEWNATKVAIERKAGFLNSFPLYLDDTRKADERILQQVVYQFSSGRAKGRGSLKGSQREATWNNILISTGEISLADYASKAGGAAARVLSLVDQPFDNGYDFSTIYKAIEDNHGAIGLEFLKKWQDQKDILIPEFYRFKDYYLNKSKSNEVLTRLSLYFAAIHFAGSVLMKLFQIKVDLNLLVLLFDEIAKENKALDKPKELLEQILGDIDADREAIYYDFEPRNGIKAVYKDGMLFLTPSYLKNILGPEMVMIRREWRKKGYTFSFESKGKIVDYRQLKHSGRNFQVVPLAKEIVSELGFDFEVTKTFE
jgi:putative DNA primase/helicase